MNESMANSEVVQATEKVDDVIFDASIDVEQFSDYKVTNILKTRKDTITPKTIITINYLIERFW